MADKSFLAWPFFEERHRRLADEAERWAADNVPALADHHDIDGSCRRLVEAMGAAGFLAHAAPEDERFDVRSLCILRETFARHDGLADFAFAMQGLGTGALTLSGSDELKRRILPGVRAGETIAAFALTEPEAGSDVAQIALKATPAGNDMLRLDGEKIWISNGGIADHYVVFARTGEAPGAKGLSAFFVPADTPGLVIAERLETIAPHPLARLTFDDCCIPTTNRIGNGGDGFKIAMATLDVFRSTVGAAWTRDAGAPRITREAAMAKMVATENAQEVIDRAVQIHGAEGVRSGSVPETLYREIRALRIYEGATEVQKLIIARQLLSQVA
ncbi:acyl-CoA dehydrogenase family protein [Aurantimonas sp. C2-5-R2]|uniref:acyl-CoA dehydrogenase family protein n=1 Tax=Aurantimonas sp. C2-5-R2 TaxID=3113713 RepID=UPI002F94BEAE